ncbi:hypothetical protein ACFZB9_30885 [Kitasatospora sp. NPDC008050]
MDIAIDVLAEDLVVEDLTPSAQLITVSTAFSLGTWGSLAD